MPAAQRTMEKKKFKFTVPHVFVILAIIMLLVFIVSFFVPSGNFERVLDENSGREIVNPDVFNWVEKQYLTFSDYFQSFYNGIVGGISIMGNLCSSAPACWASWSPPVLSPPVSTSWCGLPRARKSAW